MSLKNKKVCLTGALSMTRAEAAVKIAAAGGRVMSGVSKNTDIVVCGDKSGSKLAEAEALGVEVWDESDLIAALSKSGKSKASSAKAPPAKKAKVAPKKKAPAKSGVKKSFAGKKFCITGTLGLMKRAEAVTKIMNAGGEVVAKPSKNVDFMIVGDDAGSKEYQALALGIECWDEEEFVGRLEGAGGYEDTESEEEEDSESDEPPSPPTKTKGGATASMWDTFVKSGMFSCMTVEADGTEYPLRKDQKDELKRWNKGTWDSAWLVVKSGVPRHFVASDGSANVLKLKV